MNDITRAYLTTATVLNRRALATHRRMCGADPLCTICHAIAEAIAAVEQIISAGETS